MKASSLRLGGARARAATPRRSNARAAAAGRRDGPAGLAFVDVGAADAAERLRQAIFPSEGGDGLGVFYADLASYVDADAVNAAYDALNRFHALPKDEKARVHSGLNRCNRGWVPLHEEPAYDAGAVSFVEAFDLGSEAANHAYQEDGVGANAWPSESCVPGFRSNVYGLYDDLTAAGEAFYGLLEEALGVSGAGALDAAPYLGGRLGARASHNSVAARSVMRLLRYPPVSEAEAAARALRDGVVGISAHTDFECFTFIHSSGPGLQVQRGRDGPWIDVPPPPPLRSGTREGHTPSTAFVVLVGDVLERWTNGMAPAARHRVVRPAGPARRSIVRFNGLENGTRIRPLPPFDPCVTGTPLLHPETTQGEHLAAAAQAAMANLDELVRDGRVPPPMVLPGSDGPAVKNCL